MICSEVAAAIQKEKLGSYNYESLGPEADVEGIFRALHTICPNSGDVAEVVFQKKLGQQLGSEDKKIIKQALQNAIGLARCGEKITANLGGKKTPFGKLFTDPRKSEFWVLMSHLFVHCWSFS